MKSINEKTNQETEKPAAKRRMRWWIGGSPAWRAGKNEASFSSPAPVTLGGRRQILSLNATSVSGHNHEVARPSGLSAKTWNTPALAGELLLVGNDQEAVCYQLPKRISQASERASLEGN